MRTADDFVALITPYHASRPRFAATVRLWVEAFTAVAEANADLPRAFDINEAIGVQLDKVGEWEGYTRNLPYPLPQTWFSYGDAARGYGKGLWHVPTDPQTGVVRLVDDIYRDLLRAKALFNRWDGTVPGAADIYDTFLSDPDTHSFVQDNQDFSSTLGISGEIPPLQKLMLLAAGYLPVRPATTTSAIRVTSVNRAPLFGYGVNNDFIGGYGRGAWGVTPAYLVDHGY